MQIEQELGEKRLVLRPVGRLDGVGAPQLETAINGFLNDGGKYLVIDFSKLGYISSVGLRVILMAGKRLLRDTGKIVLAGLTPNVREVFEMSGFITLFPVVADLAAAPASANTPAASA